MPVFLSSTAYSGFTPRNRDIGQRKASAAKSPGDRYSIFSDNIPPLKSAMTLTMATSIPELHQKAPKTRRSRLHKALCLPPLPSHKTAGKDNDSSPESDSVSEHVTMATTAEVGGEKKRKRATSNARPEPPNSASSSANKPALDAVQLQARICMHHYPVAPHSRAHQAYTHGGYVPTLCPHCAIAAPESWPLRFSPTTESAVEPSPAAEHEVEARRGATTIAATRCGHPITVRRLTAAIITANPLLFSAAGAAAAGAGLAGKEARQPNRTHPEYDPWPRYTRSPTVLQTDGSAMGKRVRANLNVERCVVCVRRQFEKAQRSTMLARKQEQAGNWAGEKIEMGGAVDAPGNHAVDMSGSVGMWRRTRNGLRVGLDVLEREAERAVEEQYAETGDAGTMKRKASLGSLKALESWWAKSVSLCKGKSKVKGKCKGKGVAEMRRAGTMKISESPEALESWWAESMRFGKGRDEKEARSPLKSALKPSREANNNAEGSKKVRNVRFDLEVTKISHAACRPLVLEGESEHHRPEKLEDDMLLDTSGANFEANEEVE